MKPQLKGLNLSCISSIVSFACWLNYLRVKMKYWLSVPDTWKFKELKNTFASFIYQITLWNFQDKTITSLQTLEKETTGSGIISETIAKTRLSRTEVKTHWFVCCCSCCIIIVFKLTIDIVNSCPILFKIYLTLFKNSDKVVLPQISQDIIDSCLRLLKTICLKIVV